MDVDAGRAASPDDHRFPRQFLWGAATAAHQVEGGNRWNDWWQAERAGRLPYRSGDCCRQYELYARDFELARAWGHNCHRFSIEWSRVEPEQGHWSAAALEHYRDVIRALRARALEPVVTLHHFTNPAWFAQRGGWLRRDGPALFAEYVRRVLDALGSEVRFWITINEPTVYVLQGYVNGEWPPFESGRLLEAVRSFKNLAAAHVEAYAAIKQSYPAARVGYAHSALVVEPCEARRFSDRLAARLRGALLNDTFLRLIGCRKRERFNKNLDFIGLNYYTRCCVKSAGAGMQRLFGRVCKLEHHRDQGVTSAAGSEVYPQGLRVALERFARYGLPLFVTENGIATEDDRLRCSFLEAHLAELAQAMADGVEVLGYLHWSLIDNFEWHLGTTAKFGLAAMNFETQERTPRDSMRLFGRVCRENGVVLKQSA